MLGHQTFVIADLGGSQRAIMLGDEVVEYVDRDELPHVLHDTIRRYQEHQLEQLRARAARLEAAHAYLRSREYR